jgi:hypothetical protein
MTIGGKKIRSTADNCSWRMSQGVIVAPYQYPETSVANAMVKLSAHRHKAG